MAHDGYDGKERKDGKDDKSVKDGQDVQSIKDVQDVQDVQEDQDVKSVNDVQDAKDVQHVKDTQDAKNFTNLRDSDGMNDMNDALPCDDAEMYALGGLDEAERAAFERHLRDCETCTALVEELQALVGLLPLAAEPAELPAGMQDRILGNILGETAAPIMPSLASDVSNPLPMEQPGSPIPSDATSASTEETSLPYGEPVANPASSPSASEVLIPLTLDMPTAPSGEIAPTDVVPSASPVSTESEPPSASAATHDRAATDAIGRLPIGANPSAPPSNAAPDPYLRSRSGRPARRRLAVWTNAVLAAAVILLGVYVFSLKDQISDLRGELTGSTTPAQGIHPSEAVNLSAAAQNIVANGLATIVIDRKGTHLLVQAEKLPALKGNEAFQVWLMKDGSDVVNAGTFFSRDGKGGLYLTLEQNLAGYDQIAITQEPDAFGKTPRGTAVLAAAISL